MAEKKAKWLIYTVLVGLIPLLARVFVWLVTKDVSGNFAFSASDLVAFGLVLHITNINELEHASSDVAGKSWKTVQNGLSIVFIAVYSVLLTATLFSAEKPGLINDRATAISAAVLAVSSLLLSYSIYHRLSKLKQD